jgi:hypothetical protein
MRARIWQDGRQVNLRWPDGSVSTYVATGESDYASVILYDGNRYPRVCARLSLLGSTLTSSRKSLLATIRREYRRRMAAERRELDGLYRIFG